jgi:hypothetical protein
VLAAVLVLAAGSAIHLTAILLALHPRVSEAYAERYIARTSRCLRPPPPPVVASLPARLVTFDGQRCPTLLRSGWHHSEPSLAWSSSERSAIVFALSPDLEVGRLTLHFAQMFGATVHPRTLQVLLDGVPAATSRIDRDGPFEISIAGERLKPGATHRIELLLDRLYTPDGLGLGPDQRSLGVALTSVGLGSNPNQF